MKIVYFASLRQQIGLSEEDVSLPDDVGNIRDLLIWLRRRSARHATALEAGKPLMVAIDQDYASPDSALAGAREIAFFPPVTGG